MLFVEEKGDGEVSDLLFRVLGCRDEIDGFEVSEVDVPAKYVYVQELADVFLLRVAVKSAICRRGQM